MSRNAYGTYECRECGSPAREDAEACTGCGARDRWLLYVEAPDAE